MKQSSETITRVGPALLSPRNRWIVFFSVMAALGATVYGKSLYALGVAVLDRYGSSHGLFVPFISGYLVWLKLERIKEIVPKADLFPGSGMIVAGGVLFTLGRAGEGIGLPVVSFLFVAAGLILMLFGQQVFKELAFPLFFLAAMIPLPDSVHNQMAEWMREATTWGAVLIVKGMGIPIFRDGFDIYLPKSHLVVNYACSGIRYLLSYVVFGVAYAFRYKQTFKSRALVVAGALLLSIVGGVLRLSVIFTTGYYIGPIMVEHNPHVILSWTVFTVLLVIVIAIDRYVSGSRDRGSGVRQKKYEAESGTEI